MIASPAVLVLVFATGTATSPPPHALAIRHVAVVDVEAGRVLEDRTVLVDGERIAAVLGPGASAGHEARDEVDGRGKFLIPGLWDMHVHLADPGYLPRLVAKGVTGVRDMGGGLDAAADGCESLHPRHLAPLRRQVGDGARIGPRIVFSGPALSGSGWPTSLPARTPEEAKDSVGVVAALGADFVKVYEKIPLDAYQALARAAGDAGLPFAGHVPEEGVSLPQAIGAGQRSIEHVREALLACFTPRDEAFAGFLREDGWDAEDVAWGWARRRDCPTVLAAARARSLWFTPTLVVEHAKVAAEDAAWDAARAPTWLPPTVREATRAYARGKRAQAPTERASERRWWHAQQRLVARLAQEGAALLAGTDSACQGGVPGDSLHEELRLLVAAGVPARTALAAATSEPARYLGQADAGRIAAGARADLVLLQANPLEDIGNTRRIAGVVLAGRWLDRDLLDRLEVPASDD